MASGEVKKSNMSFESVTVGTGWIARKSGDLVVLNTNNGAYTTSLTLPTEIRPSAPIACNCMYYLNGGWNTGWAQIQTSGSIVIRSATSTTALSPTYVNFSMTYLLS